MYRKVKRLHGVKMAKMCVQEYVWYDIYAYCLFQTAAFFHNKFMKITCHIKELFFQQLMTCLINSIFMRKNILYSKKNIFVKLWR